jgi:hypothetical protein
MDIDVLSVIKNGMLKGQIMKWIKCSDRMPEGIFQYEYCLTYSSLSREHKILYYLKDENEWHSGGGATYEFHEITHWMPLPEKP